jgi:Cu/Ag efflux protein CusF
MTDIRTVSAGALLMGLVLLLGVGCGSGGNPTSPTQTGTVSGAQSWTGRGVVVDLQRFDGGSAVELDHEPIPDLMPGMVMFFQLGNPALLNQLRRGDRVRFTLELHDGGSCCVISSISRT